MRHNGAWGVLSRRMVGRFSWTKSATYHRKSKSYCYECCKNVKSNASAVTSRFQLTYRVLGATHRDLNALVAEGKFRQDLLYRLNVVPIEMPSLRERAADIPLLAEYFIGRFGKKAGKKFRTIDKQTLRLFQAYGWPGNIRELQNVIERAVILSEGDTFSLDESWLKPAPSQVAAARAVALSGVLHTQEKEMIEAALAESHGRIAGPAGAAAN